MELRRRTRRGLQVQANYTFSKSLSDAAGTDPAHDEPYLDFNNRTIERSRTPFDFTHVIRANSVVDLPFGKGRKLNWRRLERLLSGWTTGTILTWQSGAPFSILSGRGTFNTIDRSRFTNTATSVLTKPELDRIFGLRQTGNGPYFIAASAIGPDGRAVADERRPPFSGQVFFHPDAGTVGSLQRRMFSGPWTFNLDASLVKSTMIAERHRLELRLDASNVLNHPVWSIGDQQLDSPNFGRAGGGARRVVQVGVIYRW